VVARRCWCWTAAPPRRRRDRTEAVTVIAAFGRLLGYCLVPNSPPHPSLSLQQRRNLELIVGRGLRLCDFWYGLEPKLRAALFGRVFLVRFIAWFSAFLVRFSLLYLCFRLLFANRVNLEDNVLASCPV